MSCELHLDFGRKIRYNNYVVCKIEYAGVSEWQRGGLKIRFVIFLSVQEIHEGALNFESLSEWDFLHSS